MKRPHAFAGVRWAWCFLLVSSCLQNVSCSKANTQKHTPNSETAMEGQLPVRTQNPSRDGFQLYVAQPNVGTNDIEGVDVILIVESNRQFQPRLKNLESQVSGLLQTIDGSGLDYTVYVEAASVGPPEDQIGSTHKFGDRDNWGRYFWSPYQWSPHDTPDGYRSLGFSAIPADEPNNSGNGRAALYSLERLVHYPWGDINNRFGPLPDPHCEWRPRLYSRFLAVVFVMDDDDICLGGGAPPTFCEEISPSETLSHLREFWPPDGLPRELLITGILAPQAVGLATFIRNAAQDGFFPGSSDPRAAFEEIGQEIVRRAHWSPGQLSPWRYFCPRRWGAFPSETRMPTPLAGISLGGFAGNSVTITPEGQKSLDDFARVRASYQEKRFVVVQGHSDSTEGNQVARERASGVVNFLESRGIASGDLRLDACGSSRPMANNDTAAGRSFNRRVEVWTSTEALQVVPLCGASADSKQRRTAPAVSTNPRQGKHHSVRAFPEIDRAISEINRSTQWTDRVRVVQQLHDYYKGQMEKQMSQISNGRKMAFEYGIDLMDVDGKHPSPTYVYDTLASVFRRVTEGSPPLSGDECTSMEKSVFGDELKENSPLEELTYADQKKVHLIRALCADGKRQSERARIAKI